MIILDEHDIKEIETLKALKEWHKWYRNLSEKRKEEYLMNRWKNEQIGEDNF